MDGKDVEIEWMPFELRPYPQETLSPNSEYVQKGWHSSVKPLAEKLGVTMNLPMIDPMPHTHYAHEGLMFAKKEGKAHEYAVQVFRAYYEDGQDIGNINVLTDLAEKIGLDRFEFEQSLQKRTFSDEREKLVKETMKTGEVLAVPTVYIDGEKLTGLQTKEKYETLINRAKRN
ncbi:DsbA family protein [Bacillus shivajii]|uniref:DsbA family oxidoreductase n=1 Tax=Bacillus shivajii TaxID=1983719 RepID=UPI001CFBCF61|nr:DsbA family protein [Bacillus shivajii]UCZ55387.1 DsbA family protein [Bacillus shivajii]